MTSLPLENEKAVSKKGWLLFIVLSIVALSANVAHQVRFTNTEQTVPVTAVNNTPPDQEMPAAVALASGKPTLLFFYPVEMCQIRYCRQASFVAEEMGETYGNRINFVNVPVYAISGEESDTRPAFLLADWGIFPVPEITAIMPNPVQTPHGWSLMGPTAVLIGPDHQLLYQGEEFFDVAELTPALALAQPPGNFNGRPDIGDPGFNINLRSNSGDTP